MFRKLDLQLFADDSAQEPLIPDDWHEGLDEEFINEIKSEAPELAEPGVKGDPEPKINEPENEPKEEPKPEVKEPETKEPDYKQMYENMQKALREEREKNDRRLKNLEEKFNTQTKPPEKPKEKTPREEAKERLIAKYGDYNPFDEEQSAELAEIIADIKIERKFSAEKQEQQRLQMATIEQQFVGAYNDIFNGEIDAQELDTYAMNKLRSMPLEKGYAIQMALNAVNSRQLTPEVINVLQPYYKACKDELKTAKATKTAKVEQIANLPRASQMRGGGAPSDTQNIEEMYEKWDTLTPKQQDELLRTVFKFKNGE